MWRCSLVPQSTSNLGSANSVHGLNTGTLGEREVSTRAPRTRYASKSSPCRLCQLPKWQNLEISCFCHVRRDSGAPITWRRWLKQIYAWVEQRNSRWVCWQKIKTKAPAIFENKPMRFVLFRNGVLTWFWLKTALAQIQISECSSSSHTLVCSVLRSATPPSERFFLMFLRFETSVSVENVVFEKCT